MSSTDYAFVTEWRVPATLAEINAILGDATALPAWWPSVYLDVTETDPGVPGGPGKRVELYTKGWLPYTLRWAFVVTRRKDPHGFVLEAIGDFVGVGEWTFTEDGGDVLVRYDWRIRVEKGLLRRLSWLLKPLFAANHRWAMAKGEESLRLELLRRRAPDAAARAAIPAPPPPTWPHRPRAVPVAVAASAP